jgi:hypothetical protein
MALRINGKNRMEPDGSPTPKRAFRRRLLGYHRRNVEETLVQLTAALTSLEIRLQAAEFSAKQEDLVLRATRRSVEDVLKRAEKDANDIRRAAEAASASLLAEVFGPLRTSPEGEETTRNAAAT